MDHTKRTIQTYDQIAAAYHVIATPEHRAWLEDSMREFFIRLPGASVLVAGCGEGRDSRYLHGLGARVMSSDLSDGSNGILSVCCIPFPAVRGFFNLIERWFAELDQNAVRRGAIRSVRDLQHGRIEVVAAWNRHPQPFLWPATMERIFATMAPAGQL